MYTKKKFSIIELLTVILVILLLISLLIPFFVSLKINAQTALCKNQMRQLGVLMTSYAASHDGYLPNDNQLDIPAPSISNQNNNYYANWNGHLLPFLDNGIKSYNRTSKLTYDGSVYTYDYSKGQSTFAPADELTGGWVVIRDACYKGGYNDLKLFICPAIHAGTYDIGVSNDFNGTKIPRISQMANWNGFVDHGHGHLGGGLPTTYLANDVFFGFDGPYMGLQLPLRIDQINAVSKKAFLVEGGLGWAKNSNGEPEYLYYRISKGYLSGNIGTSKASTGGHVHNYVHDRIGTFWLIPTNRGWTDMEPMREIATKFNIAFAGKASMVEYDFNYNIFTQIDPQAKPFDKFFKAYPGVAILPYVTFDEPEFHYLEGNMNVLFGDGSVMTKDKAWLSMNRALIGQLSKE